MYRLGKFKWAIAFAMVLGLLAVAAPGLRATPSLQTAFVATYPAVADSKLDSCGTCHMPAQEDFLNAYGLDLREAKLKFKAIEAKDSDGDNKTNLEEIASAQLPGSFARYPEYYLFNNKKGVVHFNHEAHVAQDNYMPPGACRACHGPDMFKRKFDDRVSIRESAHRLCIRCHKRSGKPDAPTRCSGCHEKDTKDAQAK